MIGTNGNHSPITIPEAYTTLHEGELDKTLL